MVKKYNFIMFLLLISLCLCSLPVIGQDVAELYCVKTSIGMGAGFSFFTEFRLNLPDNRLSSFIMEFIYDSSCIQPTLNKGVSGVTMNPAQISVTADTANSYNGRYIVTGTCNQPLGPGNALPFLTVHWSCVGSGVTNLKLTITKFAGSEQEALPLAKSDLSIPVSVGGYCSGDVKMDLKVDINDALLVARFAAGLESLSAVRKDFADVNFDDKVDIIDAMLIARYTAKLVHVLPVEPVYGQ